MTAENTVRGRWTRVFNETLESAFYRHGLFCAANPFVVIVAVTVRGYFLRPFFPPSLSPTNVQVAVCHEQTRSTLRALLPIIHTVSLQKSSIAGVSFDRAHARLAHE